MKDFIFIIPYFGKLPIYLPAFLHSIIPLQDSVDFLFITNCEEINEISTPKNFKVKISSFEEMQRCILEKKLGHVYDPYKLCDYKPLFGLIFDEDIQGYKYWGHCDIDVMMGDVIGFLNKINYAIYDRIGVAGHFTLYKNKKEINELALTQIPGPKYLRWSFVNKTTMPCHFDEYGMNLICDFRKIHFYKNNHHLQPNKYSNLHLHTSNKKKYNELFVWDKGHIYLYTRDSENNIHKKEFMYLHFEARKDIISVH